jgi:hypothetical protein
MKAHGMDARLVVNVNAYFAIYAARVRLAQGNDAAPGRLADVKRALVIKAEEPRLFELVRSQGYAQPRPHRKRRHARPHVALRVGGPSAAAQANNRNHRRKPSQHAHLLLRKSQT